MLTLRGSLTPGSRRDYAQTLAGAGAGAPRRARTPRSGRCELLFERLAVRWVIAGAPIERQRELLGRLRMASRRGARVVRAALREHCAEHFPDVELP